MTLYSPFTGETLELIDGDAGDILKHANSLVTSSEDMHLAANRLEDICNGTTDLKSEAITKVRESASEVFPKLRQAAVRYEGTGKALQTYAGALDSVQGAFARCTAQGGVDNYALLSTLNEDIRTANTTAISRRNSEDEAQSLVNEHNGFLGMGEGTDEQKEDAADQLSTASTARQKADEELDELWGKFDGRVSYWEDAYDDAVHDIEKAFEAAGNDDSWYDNWGDFLNNLGLVLGLVALVFTGPIAIIAGAVALAISVVLLAVEVYKFANDESSLGELLFAIAGVLPFGRGLGKVFTSLKGAKNFKGFFKALGRSRTSRSTGMVRKSIHPSKRRPKMTKVKGNAKQRRKIREQNRTKKRDFNDSHDRDKKKYLDGFEDDFSKNKIKMYYSYISEGRSAKERALVEYMLEHPHKLTREAREWAQQMQTIAGMEDWADYVIGFGIDQVQKQTEANK